ncbi:MAG: CvpA family protein [Cytophagales bacterium]|nr:CvpA family protein [Cytophagales bacterium]
MVIFDILIVAFVVFAGIKGYKRGFIVEVFSLLAFFIGLFIALKLTFPIAMKFFGNSDAFWIIALVIFIALFLLLVWGIKHLAESIKKVVDFTLAGIIDNILGVGISIIKWLFVFSVTIWVMSSVDLYLPSRWIKGSDLYYVVASIAPVTFELIAGLVPFFEDILENMQEPPSRSSVIVSI